MTKLGAEEEEKPLESKRKSVPKVSARKKSIPEEKKPEEPQRLRNKLNTQKWNVVSTKKSPTASSFNSVVLSGDSAYKPENKKKLPDFVYQDHDKSKTKSRPSTARSKASKASLKSHRS